MKHQTNGHRKNRINDHRKDHTNGQASVRRTVMNGLMKTNQYMFTQTVERTAT